MKKTTGLCIIIALIAVCSLSSCKKDYTCTCTFPTSTTPLVTPFNNVTKKAAQKSCDDLVTFYGGGTCTLN